MRARAAGFSLVSAIFLMVVLAILGVSLVSLSAVQHATAAQQLQTVRANYAARAGVEWAARQAAAGACAGTTFTPGGTLTAFTVTVACTPSTHDLGGGTQLYYLVDVTAQAGAYGSPDFVARRVQAKVLGGP